MSFCGTKIHNYDVDDEYFFAFTRSIKSQERSNSSDAKRSIYTCTKIERFDNKFELIKQKIEESKVECNVIIAIDINDKTKDREPHILKENGPIIVIEICITSRRKMKSDTKLIEDIMKHPEKQIEEIIKEWKEEKLNRDLEKKSGCFTRLLSHLCSSLFTSSMPAQTDNRHFETKSKHMPTEQEKRLEDLEMQKKILLQQLQNMEIKNEKKIEIINEQYKLLVQQLNYTEIEYEKVKEFIKILLELLHKHSQNSMMESEEKFKYMQNEKELHLEKHQNIEREQKMKEEEYVQKELESYF